MQGDITRSTFQSQRHYRNVRQQQGRVGLDADWNEQADITAYRAETEARDVIGRCGAPQHDAGFALTGQGGGDFEIGAGRFYVDGILCENEAGSPPVRFTTQPDLRPAALTGPGRYLVGLDVWLRHISALDDSAIREVALGGPDTATRAQVVWQVKALLVGAADTCPTEPSAWKELIAPSTARLSARVAVEEPSDQPCILPPGAGYRRLENQLYRVEIHRGGPVNDVDPTGATFKWSRDNGSIAARIQSMAGDKITLASARPDSALGFAAGQWVEIIDDQHEWLGLPGTLMPIVEVNGLELKVDVTQKIASPTDSFPPEFHPKVRRWDSVGATPATMPVTNDGFLSLEDGVQVKFSAGTVHTADYWLIPARTNTGNVEWPQDSATPPNPSPQEPHGIAHHFCRLAILEVGGNGVVTVVEDCRPLFPPLTEREECGGCCTLTARPDRSLQDLFDQIKPGGHAHVCFPVGTYDIPETVVIAGKGHLTLSGCGNGTKLRLTASQPRAGEQFNPDSGNFKPRAALFFQNCGDVTVRDLRVEAAGESALYFHRCGGVRVENLSAESGTAETGDLPTLNLNGTVSILDCTTVTVESTHLRCGSGGSRRAACLSVRDDRKAPEGGPTAVRVRHCDVRVGFQQVGLLLVNADRAEVEDNRIEAVEIRAADAEHLLRVDAGFRARFRHALLFNARLTAPVRERPGAGVATVTVARGDSTIHFETEPALAAAWSNLLSARLPQAVGSPRELLTRVYRVADDVLRNAGRVELAPAFREWFRGFLRDDPSVASQGIVVGGTVARDVRILDNSISGVLQGVHVGLSHGEDRRGSPDRAGTVRVAGNTINIVLPARRVRERHGIFVGNADTVFIENNHVIVTGRRARTPIDGVRVFGHLGRMMIVRENHLVNVTIGVHVELPAGAVVPNNRRWLVSWNMAPSSTSAVSAPDSVRKIENLS